jgi:hypothetical protein
MYINLLSIYYLTMPSKLYYYKYKQDPEYIKKENERTNQIKKSRYDNDEEYRNLIKLKSLDYYHKNKNYSKPSSGLSS